MGAPTRDEHIDGAGAAAAPGAAVRSVLPRNALDPPTDGVVTSPNSARMLDYYLGGSANFDADRRAADALSLVDPSSSARLRANRLFAVRALRWCVRRGIDQVLDLGCGLSAVHPTHAAVRDVDPQARVAYVDLDPVATEHVGAVTAGMDGVTVTRADLARVDDVLTAPGVRAVLDLTRPVTVIATGSPHWVGGDLAAVTARYRAALAPGSALVLSQRTHDGLVGVDRSAFDTAIEAALGPMVVRTHAEVAAAFAGFDLVEPGVVDVAHWPAARPGQPAMSYWGGVGVRAADG